MKPLDIISLGVLFVLFQSCNNTDRRTLIRNGEINPDIYIVDIDNTALEDRLNLSNYFQNATVIPLEINDDCIISNISSMQTTEKYFFILDRRQGNVLMFNKKGEFLKNIGRRGQGPGEHLSLTDFTIDESKQEIYLVDPDSEKVNLYNYESGLFLKVMYLSNKDGRPWHIQYDEGQLWGDMFYYDRDQENKYMLQSIDIENGVQNTTWLDIDIYNKGWHELAFKPESFFYSRNQKSPKYTQILMDTVLFLDDNEVKPYFAINDSYWITSEDVKRIIESNPHKERGNHIIANICMENLSHNISNFVEVGNIIYFKFQRMHTIFYVIYDIQTRKAIITNNLQNDLTYNKSVPIENIGCADENGIYGYIEPEMMPYFVENVRKKNLNTNLKGKDALNDISEESNPIIFYYEFKE